MRKLLNILTLTALAGGLMAGGAHATAADYTLEIRNGAFSPATLEVPANEKVHLTVRNNETVEAEFESYPLDREEKIDPGEQTELYVGPLEAGAYEFFDDNNPDAKGILIAK